MTSDELFWHLVLCSRSVEEASLVWWLVAVRADERAYREPPRTLERALGLTRTAVFRVRATLEVEGIVSTRTLASRSTEFNLNLDELNRRLASLRVGHSTTVSKILSPTRFDPFAAAGASRLADATANSRLCMLRRNREDAVLLAWLHQAGAAISPVRVSSRDMEGLLCGFVDRRTAMRGMTRLQTAGLVAVTPMGRAGTEYRLDGAALEALLATFPFPEDAAATMPGWANLDFPLLHRLAPSGAEAKQAAESAALEVQTC